MTTPSEFSAKGLSILVHIPLVQGNDVVGNYSDIVSSYTHTISANGGYTSAEFNMTGNNEFIESWLEFGLGRHIIVYGPQQQVIWEGFVNEINANMGGATFSRGPLTSIANYVWGVYTPILREDPDPDNPGGHIHITGTIIPAHAVLDDFSRERYGLWEKLLNLGTLWTEEAEYIRDLYLEEYKDPEGNPSLSLSDNAGELSVTVSCRGYIDLLGYTYNYTDDNISVYLSEIIKDILTEDPNTVISTNYNRIDENLVIQDPFTEENKTAKTLIDDILAMGGGDDDRWTFGIYKDRMPIYSAIPTEVEYVYYKTGRNQQVETLAGEIIDPWSVVPCKWVAIPTFLYSSGIKPYNIRDDPRVFFGEEVTYTAPDQVTISGAKIRRITQYLAKLGLGGV
jgi:hypothetical protein